MVSAPVRHPVPSFQGLRPFSADSTASGRLLCLSPGPATFWISLLTRDPLFGHGRVCDLLELGGSSTFWRDVKLDVKRSSDHQGQAPQDQADPGR